MSVEQQPPQPTLTRAEFDAFYHTALPVVFGYLLRLCGGNREDAWDLTQDSWLTVVDGIGAGAREKATVAYVLSVARSRYLDRWRRQQLIQRKLRLVWAVERTTPNPDPTRAHVLDHIESCSPKHRAVLMLAYVDDLPVADIAGLLGTSSSTAYALLEHARAELRQHVIEDTS